VNLIYNRKTTNLTATIIWLFYFSQMLTFSKKKSLPTPNHDALAPSVLDNRALDSGLLQC